MSPEFNIVLINVVKIINYIKSYALNSRLFEQLCEEMEAEYICLLLYIEIRWLSRGKSQLRIFELRKPLQTFLLEKKSPLAVHFSDELEHDHLSLILKEFERYFPSTKDPRTSKEWICDPSTNWANLACLCKKIQLLEIPNDGGLRTTLETTTLPVFWIKVMVEYREIATTSLKSLLPFPTTYLCEVGFSAVTSTKTRQRNKLDISNTLRVSLSPITLRWNRLIAKKHTQGSH
ncbi:SCAN domain-containing protein 3 [Trichonephila clavata]|uniref:SCAN domain-containing protein 3 n=1 Tax=Trichonephila clavata TaxID=2740835 RepID=A0A8X6G0C8_TRICU|nr:SCAN domain-containing protein 3 [Trichonephila clavata]